MSIYSPSEPALGTENRPQHVVPLSHRYQNCTACKRHSVRLGQKYRAKNAQAGKHMLLVKLDCPFSVFGVNKQHVLCQMWERV